MISFLSDFSDINRKNLAYFFKFLCSSRVIVNKNQSLFIISIDTSMSLGDSKCQVEDYILFISSIVLKNH